MADNDKKYVPQLRFPEFVNDGEWNITAVADVIHTIVPSKKLKSSEYKNEGEFPIIDQSQNYIAGYSDDSSALLNTDDKTCVIFGDHTCSLKSVDFPFVQGADGIKIFYSDEDLILTRYLYQYLLAHPLNAKEYKRHFSELREIKVIYPKNISEQRKIADCLSSLDSYIDALKNKLEQLKEHKTGLMQKLFPAKGKTVPEIRFPEFQNDGEWSILNLADIIHTITPSKKLKSSEYKNKGKYPIIDQSQNYIAGYSDDSSALLNTDNKTCVIFGDHTCVLKSVDFPFIQGADGIKIFYSDSPCITTAYLYVYLSAHPIVSKEYKRHFLELKEIDVLYPANKKEQDKISESFTSIDEVIDRCINKINTLELFKSGLLRQLFPKL